jgi:UDP-glucose 4-epimerase
MKNVGGVDFKVDQESKRAGDPALLISDNSKILKAWDSLKNSELKSKQPKLFKYDNLELICKTALDWERNS